MLSERRTGMKIKKEKSGTPHIIKEGEEWKM